jgi:hypothetical protein
MREYKAALNIAALATTPVSVAASPEPAEAVILQQDQSPTRAARIANSISTCTRQTCC